MFLVKQGEYLQTRQPWKKKSGSELPHSKWNFLQS